MLVRGMSCGQVTAAIPTRLGITIQAPIVRVTPSTTKVHPTVRPMYMRTVAGTQTTFISESFMDELAAAAKIDPIQFRINHLPPATQDDLIRTLEAAKAMSGWQSRPSPGPNTGAAVMAGRGIGLSTRGPIAHVAEVEVTRKTGVVKVKRIFVAVNIGSLVTPDGTAAQVEGGTIMGLSRAIKDQVVFGKKQITSGDWVTYPIVRFTDVPASIEIDFLPPETPEVPAGGIGEPASQAVPAAVANAIFDATGVRIRRPPFTPARVRAALKSAGVA